MPHTYLYTIHPIPIINPHEFLPRSCLCRCRALSRPFPLSYVGAALRRPFLFPGCPKRRFHVRGFFHRSSSSTRSGAAPFVVKGAVFGYFFDVRGRGRTLFAGKSQTCSCSLIIQGGFQAGRANNGMPPRSRIMYIEPKGDGVLGGTARIGRVTYSKSGRSLVLQRTRIFLDQGIQGKLYAYGDA